SHLSRCRAPATTEICTLSLHDALPIFRLTAALLASLVFPLWPPAPPPDPGVGGGNVLLGNNGESVTASGSKTTSGTARVPGKSRSEEHTSELQSRENLVCRLLLEKKKQ